MIGGERAAVLRVVQALHCKFLPLPDSTTVHCSVAREVAEAYRELHRLPVTPPPGIRFYSTALGKAYDVTEDSAAEAILAQALDTVDYPATIEAAYRDGVRLFLEIGPGASCSRMIGVILGDRPHRARSACVPGADAVGTMLRLLAQLAAERVPLNLDALYGEEEEETPAAQAGRSFVMPVGGDAFRVPPLPVGAGRASRARKGRLESCPTPAGETCLRRAIAGRGRWRRRWWRRPLRPTKPTATLTPRSFATTTASRAAPPTTSPFKRHSSKRSSLQGTATRPPNGTATTRRSRPRAVPRIRRRLNRPRTRFRIRRHRRSPDARAAAG